MRLESVLQSGIAHADFGASIRAAQGRNGRISVFRASCVAAPEAVLAVFAESKRSLYALVAISVSDIYAMGLSVEPASIAEVSGHALIPELNAEICKADKQWCDGIKKGLAILASNRVLRAPVA